MSTVAETAYMVVVGPSILQTKPLFLLTVPDRKSGFARRGWYQQKTSLYDFYSAVHFDRYKHRSVYNLNFTQYTCLIIKKKCNNINNLKKNLNAVVLPKSKNRLYK